MGAHNPWAVRSPWVPAGKSFWDRSRAGAESSSCIFCKVPYEGQPQSAQSLFTSSLKPLTPSRSGLNKAGFSQAPSRDAHAPGCRGSLGNGVMKGYGWEKPLGSQNPGLTAWSSHGMVHMGWLSGSRACVLPRAAQHSFSSLQRQPRAGRSEESLGSMRKTQCHPMG